MTAVIFLLTNLNKILWKNFQIGLEKFQKVCYNTFKKKSKNKRRVKTMKKTLKTIILSLILAVALAFTGCGVSQSTADKINEAAKNGEPLSVEEVKDMVGDPLFDGLVLGTGVIIYVAGCDSWEEVEENVKAEKPMKALIVTCAVGKATGAVYNDNYKGEKK